MWLVNIPVQVETILHGKFECLKMSDNVNQNISMPEINNNSILNERQVHQNSEQRFTTESELTWPMFHCSYFIIYKTARRSKER
jgi:hypothetical protein